MKKNKRIPDFDHSAFAERFHYDGNDLGSRYTPAGTAFRVWAPTATAVEVLLYASGHEPENPAAISMAQDRNGTWFVYVGGDLKGAFYRYRLLHPGAEAPVEAMDPYAVTCGANGDRAMIVDLRETDPKGWAQDRKPSFGNPVDAIIYEVHVRDFTVHATAGNAKPGTYIGLVAKGTKGPDGIATGLDHLRELGVTHVHLLPVHDFASVDELKPKGRYNWGYDPKNYNIPEGWYATDPVDGHVRVREFKQMVAALHKAGLRVVLDVVYNHTYHGPDSHLNLIAPGYYYRQDAKGGFSNGSGCGNETASDRSMVRKMMVDSLVHWAKEYHVDGFRFDLMGLHDLETMKAIRAAMDKIDRSILLYGEGWTGGDSPLAWEQRAMKPNVAALPRIAAFNDTLRDAIKGHVAEHAGCGFVQGKPGGEEQLKSGIAASVRHKQIAYPKGDTWNGPWAAEPHHCVSYNSCHDNHTLWDKLVLTTKGMKEADRIRMNKLAAAIVLTSQGMVFLHAGEEMLRTKKGVENSYNHPDRINAMDWKRKQRYRDVVAYYRGLIALRKAHPAFRMPKAAMIRRSLSFLLTGPGVVGYVIDGKTVGDTASMLAVVFNANAAEAEITLPAAGWKVLADAERAAVKPFRTLKGAQVVVPGRSALVLMR